MTANIQRIGALRMAVASSTSAETHLARVRDFIAEWSRPDMKARRCLYFCLFKDSEDGPSPINTNEIQKGIEEGERVKRCEDIAQKFLEDASLAVDMGSGRAQLFSVGAFTSLSPDSAPLSQIPFKLASAHDVAVGMAESESPTAQGALSLSMRWNENLNKGLVTLVDRVLDRNERTIDALLSRLERSEDRNIKLAEQRETLLDKHLERQITAKKAAISMDREDRWMRAAEVYLLGMANKIMPGANPMSHPLVEWMQKNPESIMGFMSQLPKEKQDELKKIFMSLDAASGASAAKGA